MINPKTAAAGDALAQLRERVAAPHASATDWPLADSAPVLANVRARLEALAGR